MAITDHEVAIVGAGPTGLMLAAELALAKVDVVVVERRPSQDLVGMRAQGVHARTIELFDQRGIADRFLSQGQVFPTVGFAWFRLNVDDFPTRHPYGLALPQAQIERTLAPWVEELAVPIHRNCHATGFSQDDEGISLRLFDGRSLRADYLVGCDGGRSAIRKACAIAFEGTAPTISNLIAEVHMKEEPVFGLRHDALGVHALSRTKDSETVRVLMTEQHLDRDGKPTLRELSDALNAAYGTDFGVHGAVSLSRFTDANRQAASYRTGRVMLAGDAAHVHYPAGGLGLNLGVQDAVNLGWKLAQVVKRISPESLLDTYQAEQHPVAARVLRDTMAQVALLGRLDDRKAALREVVGELLSLDEPRRRFGARMSGLDIRYDLGAGHPLLGRRMPDLDLTTSGGTVRVSSLLHEGRPVLLDFGDHDRPEAAAWADRLRAVKARSAGCWELPAIGPAPAATAALVRPDGHVAWLEHANDQELSEALSMWFGEPTPAQRAIAAT